MTADEIFEKLGYKKSYDGNHFISYKRENKFIELSNGYYDGQIYIDVYHRCDGDKHSTWIDSRELKAINRKLIELGWLE